MDSMEGQGSSGGSREEALERTDEDTKVQEVPEVEDMDLGHDTDHRWQVTLTSSCSCQCLVPHPQGPHTLLEVSIRTEDMKEIEGATLIAALLSKYGFEGVWTRPGLERDSGLTSSLTLQEMETRRLLGR